MKTALVLVGLLASAGPVYALKQAKHRDISVASCTRAGLPSDFCARVGAEAYDVDAWEWNDLAAHAQIDDGQTACEAANLARERLRELGGDVRGLMWDVASTSSTASTDVAVALGRALHTVQDNCAHHGMPNPQHAWWSLSDQCHGTSLSPDVQSAAISCAQAQTDQVFAMLRSTMMSDGIVADDLHLNDTGSTHWPARGDVCHFIKTQSQEWDGVDRRWENAAVTPALLAQLQHAMTLDDGATADVCQNGELSIAQRSPNPRYNTSGGESLCLSISAYCIGKADDVDEPPPWETEEPATTQAAATGCSVAGHGEAGFIPLLLVLGLVALRRRSS